MGNDTLETYRTVLQHVVRPEESYDRLDSPHAYLQDYESLILVRALREYAAYYAPTKEHTDIALGWIEYIFMNVREEKRSSFRIYAHTYTAQEVYNEALYNFTEVPNDISDLATWNL